MSQHTFDLFSRRRRKLTVSTRTNVYKPEKSSVLLVKKKFTGHTRFAAIKKSWVAKLLFFGGVDWKISPPWVTLNGDAVDSFSKLFDRQMNVTSTVHGPNVSQSSGRIAKKL